MLKALLKKQFMEIYRSFFLDQRNGKARSKASTILFIIFYAFLMIVVVGGMFFTMGMSTAPALHELGLDWMYFALLALLGTVLGIFGSVFSTYSSLYLAKDNDLLLSLPIPVKYVLFSRMTGVYLMGLMFTAVVMLPGALAYWLTAPLTLERILCPLGLLLAVSLLVLCLSCALGWVVAKVSTRLKNKSLVTVAATILFLAGYYYVYFRAQEALKSLLENAIKVGETIRSSFSPLYVLGQAGVQPLYLALTVLAVVLLSAGLWLLLVRSFLSIATDTGSAKTVYRETAAREKSPDAALLQRELRRLFASAGYMLNGAFASFLMPIAAAFLFIRGRTLLGPLRQILTQAGMADLVPVLCCTFACLLGTMNDLTAPSISLEGKSLWLAQSLPVTPWQILRAKLRLHLAVTSPAVLLLSVALSAAAELELTEAVGVLLIPQLCVFLFAELGLFVNLKRPNLNWTNEMIVLKQGFGPMICILGGMLFSILMAGLYAALTGVLSPILYLLIIGAVMVLPVLLLLRWLRTQGCHILQSL